MKRHFLIISLMLAVACTVGAKPRTAAQLRQEAAKALSTTSMAKGKRSNAAATLKVLDRKSQLTVLGYAGGGYAVIANDDTFSPVLGYSDASLTDSHSPAFLWWMESVNSSLEKKLDEGRQPAKVRRASEYKSHVDELLVTRWNQSAPFNNMCPTYTVNGSRKNYVTGCVATSMAQMMYYHKYPLKGNGHNSYTYTSEEGYGTVRPAANFETNYDYDNMLPVYTPGNYTQEQANAVAKLMLHCGVAVEMHYTTTGSGAYSADACLALRKYFKYDESIKLYTREFYPAEEWMNMIFRELSDGCPVIYGGQSAQGGHSFILDGYDENGLVHVNWGWGGTDNGFFDIADLDGYTRGQDMVTVRTPDDTTYNGTYHSLWGLGSNLVITNSMNTLNVKCDGIYNVDVDNFTGRLAVMVCNVNTGAVTSLLILADESDLTDVPYLRGLSISNAPAQVSYLPNGTYRVYLATKSVDETDWQPVRSKETVNNSYILVKNGGSVTLRAEKDSNWTTAIGNLPTVDKKEDNRIFSLDGRYLGTDADKLGRGIYIRNGVKFIKN